VLTSVASASSGGLLDALPLLLEVAPLAAIGYAYLRRASTLAARGRAVPPARQLAFGTGLLLVFTAVGTPLAHVSEELFSAHMVQHILLGDLGALLLALGLTGPVLAPLLRLPVVGRLRVLSHPVVALPLWVLNLYLWHLSALYQATLSSAPVHALMHSLILVLGLAMWLPLVGPLPTPRWFGDLAKLAYVVLVRLAGAALANVFIWADVVFYPDYRPGQAHWGIGPLADQGVAGSVLMLEGSLITVLLLAWLFLRAAGRDEDRQRLLDLAEERGVELSDGRAGRAAAAGTGAGAALERRLRGAGTQRESEER
jgi:cytochrome c oxidase assembly factor CtaG